MVRLGCDQFPALEQLAEEAPVGLVVVDDEHPFARGNAAVPAVGVAGRAAAEADGEPESRTVARLALDADAAAHQLGQLLGNGEAESGAGMATRGRGVHLAEGPEQALS